jgi:hypothetical protein
MHAAGESLVDGGDVGFGVFHDLFGDGLAGIGEFLGDECDLGFGLDGSEAVEELSVGEASGGGRGDFNEDVDVIGHEAVREDPVAGEVLIHAHESAEFFLFVGAEGEAFVDDAGYAVVDGGLGGMRVERWILLGWVG